MHKTIRSNMFGLFSIIRGNCSFSRKYITVGRVNRIMLIIYASLTGNIKRFVNKLGIRSLQITEEQMKPVNEPFILITNTLGFGEVPPNVSNFLKDNHHFLRGVAVSGNKVWGSNYGKAGDIICNQYGVPLLLKFELSGTNQDVETFMQEVGKLYARANSEMVEIK